MSTRTKLMAVAVVALMIVAAIYLRFGRANQVAQAPAAEGGDRNAVVSSGRARTPTADPRTLPRGSIAGTVTATGSGAVAGAQVCHSYSAKGLRDDDHREPTCTTTDAAGAYRFEQLIPASYEVWASAPTFVGASWRGPAPRREDTLRLAAAEARTAVDLVLTPGGVEVHGVVEDISGGPVADALVWIKNAGGMHVARSGADGAFTGWVKSGKVRVSAWVDGYAPGEVSGIAPGQRLVILMTPESVLAGIVVAAGTRTPVADVEVKVDGYVSGSDLTDATGHFRIARLPPARYKPTATGLGLYGEPAQSVMLGLGQTVEDLVIEVHPTQVVSGKVVIDEGSGEPRPCEAGSVTLDRDDDSSTQDVEPDGTVTFESIRPGTYEVRLHCAGYVSEHEYPPVVVASADVAGLVWEVEPGGGVIVGIVRDQRATAIGDVTVRAEPIVADPRAQRSWGWEKTEPDGTFRMTGLLAGEYSIKLESSEHPDPKEPTKAMVANGQETKVELVLDDGGSISGTVVDDEGHPVGQVDVSVVGDRWDMGSGAGSSETADDGSFLLRGIAAGRYRVNAIRGWSETLRRPGTNDDDPQGAAVTVEAGKTATVKLVVESQGGKISGAVVDAAGVPVADAFVTADRESDSASALAGSAARQSREPWRNWRRTPGVTDPGGAFVVDKLSPGTYIVRAYRKGGGEAVAEHVAVGAKTTLVIEATGSIAGTVVVAGGPPPEELKISVKDEKTGVARTEKFFRTGGAFAMDELPSGTYVVRATTAGGQADTTITLADGEARTGVRLELIPFVTVTGRLVDFADGKPVAKLTVWVMPLRGNAKVGGPDGDSDGEGRFTVKRAPTGRVSIIVPLQGDSSPYGYLSVPWTLAAAGESRTVDVGDLRIPRRRTIGRDKGGDLGFDTKDTPEETEPEDAVIEVSVIRPGGPAASSGLKVGDVIVAVDGTDVTGVNRYLGWTLTKVPVGTKVKLGLRGDRTVEITAGPQP